MTRISGLLRISFTALALSATVAFAPVAQAETLKFAHFVAPAHVITPSIVEPLTNDVKAANADVDIRVYPGGELGAGPVEQYPRVLNGVADIVWGLAGYTSSQFQKSMIIELPGVVDEAGNGYGAMLRAYDTHLKDEFPGTRPLALWVSEPNVFIMRDKEIRTPADLAGLKIRVSGAVAGEVIKAFGATPVQMPANEMYNALQTGLIDGIVTGASAIRDFKLDEVAKVYIEGPSMGRILFYLVMSQAKYDALNDAQKAAVDAASGEKLSKSGEEGWQKVADETMAKLKADSSKTVISLSGDEKAAFDTIAAGVRDKIVADMDAKGVKATDALNAMLAK